MVRKDFVLKHVLQLNQALLPAYLQLQLKPAEYDYL